MKFRISSRENFVFFFLNTTMRQLTALLTPWCRVLLQKLTGLQLVKKYPAFHGTRIFITALTSVRHLSLSWATSIQSIYPHPTSWRSILILSSHLRLGLPSGLFPLKFPHQNPVHASPFPHTRHMPCPSHSYIVRIHHNNIKWVVLDCILLVFYNSTQHNGGVPLEN